MLGRAPSTFDGASTGQAQRWLVGSSFMGVTIENGRSGVRSLRGDPFPMASGQGSSLRRPGKGHAGRGAHRCAPALSVHSPQAPTACP